MGHTRTQITHNLYPTIHIAINLSIHPSLPPSIHPSTHLSSHIFPHRLTWVATAGVSIDEAEDLWARMCTEAQLPSSWVQWATAQVRKLLDQVAEKLLAEAGPGEGRQGRAEEKFVGLVEDKLYTSCGKHVRCCFAL